MSEFLKEKCGVFGVSGDPEAARRTFFGLSALQHRGQDSAGMATFDGLKIHKEGGLGLVYQVFDEDRLTNLPGSIAIGHTRYGTSRGKSSSNHIQPVSSSEALIALAHNGNLSNQTPLQEFLFARHAYNSDRNDSEMMHDAIEYYIQKGAKPEDAIREAYPLFIGAFSCVVLAKEKLIAFRDGHGLKPLSLGKTQKDSFVVASETFALDTVQAGFVRDIQPGEMLVVEGDQFKSEKLDPDPKLKLDVFELIYFMRQESRQLGRMVYEIREKFGEILAEEHPIDADIVIGVPKSGIPAAVGYAKRSGIPYRFGIIKNEKIGRTFIQPTQDLREKGVNSKYTPLPHVLDRKRVIVIDDSMVRCTTTPPLVERLRAAGASEVYALYSAAPYVFSDFYGTDTPDQSKLFCATHTFGETKTHIGADYLGFLSVEGIKKVAGDNVCLANFTGEYPVDIGRNKDRLFVPKNTLTRV